MRSTTILGGAIAGFALIASGQDQTAGCANLAQLKLDHATVVSAVAKTALDASFKLPEGATIPPYCDVKGVARPTSDSEIQFELWLPAPGAWNGKYMQRGNGGWAGFVPVSSLIMPLMRGYAVAATDDGHAAKNGPLPDASWAIGHPEKFIDFGYRALHETAIHSKAILRVYYGAKDPAHSYFAGCSDGGREALMEAQRYPEDFDGIIAGAPANNWTRHFTGFIWNEMALKQKPESDIPANKLAGIQKAALAQCDALDGVKDGLISDPRQCHFDPSVLKCTASESPDCLTQPQIDALKKIYAGPANSRTGEQIYPGYEPGTEGESGAWSVWITGPVQSMFGNSFFSGAVYEDPKWDWRTFDNDRDLKYANEKTASIVNSYSPDLRSFRAHGGKLIQYHGWGDAAIAPRDSINYYNKVEDFMARYPDPRQASAPSTAGVDNFYRLFMVPGMGHCAGGVGPVSFGNDEFMNRGGLGKDAEHDVFLALDQWVTQGIAPNKIVAAGAIHTANNSPATLTRPLCPYPKVARYKGAGDTNDAANFECAR